VRPELPRFSVTVMPVINAPEYGFATTIVT
jgi:hypothetical protein